LVTKKLHVYDPTPAFNALTGHQPSQPASNIDTVLLEARKHKTPHWLGPMLGYEQKYTQFCKTLPIWHSPNGWNATYIPDDMLKGFGRIEMKDPAFKVWCYPTIVKFWPLGAGNTPEEIAKSESDRSRTIWGLVEGISGLKFKEINRPINFEPHASVEPAQQIFGAAPFSDGSPSHEVPGTIEFQGKQGIIAAAVFSSRANQVVEQGKKIEKIEDTLKGISETVREAVVRGIQEGTKGLAAAIQDAVAKGLQQGMNGGQPGQASKPAPPGTYG
jgi:hypothetical protein